MIKTKHTKGCNDINKHATCAYDSPHHPVTLCTPQCLTEQYESGLCFKPDTKFITIRRLSSDWHEALH